MNPSARWPAWLVTATVLLIGFAITGSAVIATNQSLDRDRARRFDAAAARTRGAIGERLELYSANLAQIRAWMMADGPVTRDQFMDFTALGFEDGLYPGTQALSFAPLVAQADLPAFEAGVRAEAPAGDNQPPFTVHPPSDANDSYVVTFIAPVVGNEAALGFDLASDPARREAVEAARDRGDSVGTAPIRLVQESGDQTGFVLLAPVYDTTTVPPTEPARRRHFVGVISAVFRLDDMFAGVLGVASEADAEMYDLGPTVEPPGERFDASTRLLDTAPDSTVTSTGDAEGLHGDLDLNIGDRRWRLVLTPAAGFAPRPRTLPWTVGGLGALTSLLLAAIVSATLRARGRAEQLAADMTTDLRVAEERSASILLGAPDAMLVIDGHGVIRRVNLATEALFGHAAGDLEGQPVEILLPEALGDAHRAHRSQYLGAPRRREMGAELELLARRQDGTEFAVEVSLSPLIGAHHSLEVIAAVRDVSERRGAQAALQDAYEHERETAERLREIDELKNQFLNTVSHELRTPLTAIVGFTELLLANPLPEHQRDDYLERIGRNAQSLGGLIGDVLVFARVDNDDWALDPMELDLSTQVRLIVDQLSPILEHHHVVIDAPSPVPALVDSEALTRIMTNLLTNVVRYSPAGTTVTIATAQRDGRALLSVADEGPGIPVEEQLRVFDRFFRGSMALASRTPGTGIGLAVVSDLARRSGGSARVVSSRDIGAHFEIDLPSPTGSE